MSDSHNELTTLLEKARREELLDGSEIAFLLGLTQKSQIDALFEAARELRSRHFGEQIFLYGFVYTSTFCRNHCNFCYYRRSNAVSYKSDSSLIFAMQVSS